MYHSKQSKVYSSPDTYIDRDGVEKSFTYVHHGPGKPVSNTTKGKVVAPSEKSEELLFCEEISKSVQPQGFINDMDKLFLEIGVERFRKGSRVTSDQLYRVNLSETDYFKKIKESWNSHLKTT